MLHYLYVHRHVGLRYAPGQSSLSGVSDSDWATKHSTTGFVFHFAQAAISWGSKKQTTIALSSCEAEIMAASEACKEGIYLDNLLNELGESGAGPFPLGTDNTGARALATPTRQNQ